MTFAIAARCAQSGRFGVAISTRALAVTPRCVFIAPGVGLTVGLGSDPLAMLRWMLAHGADPERLGGWPAVRAIVLAAITGLPEYVDVLIETGATTDVFVHAVRGDVAAVCQLRAGDGLHRVGHHGRFL